MLTIPQRRPYFLPTLLAAAALLASAASAQSVSGASFVNGLALSGGTLDLSAGNDAERRLGYFSELNCDRNRNE